MSGRRARPRTHHTYLATREVLAARTSPHLCHAVCRGRTYRSSTLSVHSGAVTSSMAELYMCSVPYVRHLDLLPGHCSAPRLRLEHGSTCWRATWCGRRAAEHLPATGDGRGRRNHRGVGASRVAPSTRSPQHAAPESLQQRQICRADGRTDGRTLRYAGLVSVPCLCA